MRTEIRFLVGAGGFGILMAGVYWVASYEDAGTALLLFMGMAAAFVGAYLLIRARAARATYPEDDPQAEHAAQAGERLGRFSTGSIWPLVVGAGTAIAAYGLLYGFWLVLLGAVVFLWGVVGLMMESRG